MDSFFSLLTDCFFRLSFFPSLFLNVRAKRHSFRFFPSLRVFALVNGRYVGDLFFLLNGGSFNRFSNYIFDS